MLTDAIRNVYNGRRIQSFPIVSSFIARPIYLHAAAYRSSDCRRWMLIITLSTYNRTPINNLVAGY